MEFAKKGVVANELAETANRSKLTDVPEGVAGEGRVSPLVSNPMLGLVLSGMKPLMGGAVDPLFRTPGEQAERTVRRVTAPLTAPIDAAREYLRPGSTERAQQQASIVEQERKERALQDSLYANAPVIDPAESKRREAESATAAPQRPTITTEGGQTRMTVPGAIGEANFGTNDARSARFEQSARLGNYAPRALAPEEQVRRNMIATQAGISPDYVPVAERVNELNRATRAVRNLRAANLGLNEDLFDLAGGDPSQARRYQRAMEAGLARGAGFGGRGGSGGGGLGAAYGDMMEKAAAAKTPEDLYGNKGAQWGGTLGTGDASANQMTWALQGLGTDPRAASLAAGMTGLLQQGAISGNRPEMASLAPFVANVRRETSWAPWRHLPGEILGSPYYYEMLDRYGKKMGETDYGYNTPLELWMREREGPK
jgi:hypothetical protein